MCPSIALLGDMGTDHDGFHPSPIISASPDVLLDNKPVARQGDALAPHTKPKHGPHPRSIAGGEASVLINGKPVAVTGSDISCGGVVIGSGSARAG
ncbi:type VI secretion system PAAR protein [Pseudaeromonas paramecii]|uniref:Type VI secretion system PAAR protein n=1 Tax=Pseudaeromonas paramecii TaxID=2138166 RepID=A0ABP8Q512_9GAMM